MDGRVKPLPYFYAIGLQFAKDSALSRTVEKYFTIFKREPGFFIVHTAKPSSVTKFILFENEFVTKNRIQIKDYSFNEKSSRASKRRSN